MMRVINLDTDVLRTLVTAYQLGSFNRAADTVGRSQSAISQQMHKLEERIGLPLFQKQGRGLALTEAGEIILAYARRIVDLNDEAIAAVTGMAVDGTVRFGMPGDFAESWLPSALGRFKRAHPTVLVEAVVDRNTLLIERVRKGQIDLALVLAVENRGGETLASLPMTWIGGKNVVLDDGQPIPLAVFEQPCAFRAAAIAALDAAQIPWRIEFTSPSIAGLWAAVDAGLGITVRTSLSAPGNLSDVGKRFGLPKLPAVELSFHVAKRKLTPAAARLRDVLFETIPTELAAANQFTGASSRISLAPSIKSLVKNNFASGARSHR
jgi:DNA-binding transcriptional LysR family regulator